MQTGPQSVEETSPSLRAASISACVGSVSTGPSSVRSHNQLRTTGPEQAVKSANPVGLPNPAWPRTAHKRHTTHYLMNQTKELSWRSASPSQGLFAVLRCESTSDLSMKAPLGGCTTREIRTFPCAEFIRMSRSHRL